MSSVRSIGSGRAAESGQKPPALSADAASGGGGFAAALDNATAAAATPAATGGSGGSGDAAAAGSDNGPPPTGKDGGGKLRLGEGAVRLAAAAARGARALASAAVGAADGATSASTAVGPRPSASAKSAGLADALAGTVTPRSGAKKTDGTAAATPAAVPPLPLVVPASLAAAFGPAAAVAGNPPGPAPAAGRVPPLGLSGKVSTAPVAATPSATAPVAATPSPDPGSAVGAGSLDQAAAAEPVARTQTLGAATLALAAPAAAIQAVDSDSDPVAAPDPSDAGAEPGASFTAVTSLRSAAAGGAMVTGAPLPSLTPTGNSASGGFTGSNSGTGDPPAAPATPGQAGDPATGVMGAVGVATPTAGASDAAAGAPAAATPLASLGDAIGRQVVGMALNGGHEAVLRLHPPELGDLTLRVAVTGREVTAWFGSPEPQVQQVLSQAIGALRSGLGDAGYTLGGAWVGADASGARGGRQMNPPPLPSRPAPVGAPVAAEAGNPSPATGSGVSIYV